MAYDPTTTVGTVRLLISDVDDSPLFSDVEIGRFLALEADDTRRAAALALNTIASNEALLSKHITTRQLKLDGPAVAKALREQAADLRASAEAGDGDGVFLIAEQPDSRFWPW